MPELQYREWRDAVADLNHRNRWGYFHTLRHRSRCGEFLFVHNEPVVVGQEWPILVRIKLPVHNHEDLQRLVDGLLDIADDLRGEYGDSERTSPSDLLPFDAPGHAKIGR